MKTLFIVQDLFSVEGGIARILRLYLKAVCELAGSGDRASYVALNDTGNTFSRARSYAGDKLTSVDNCERSKMLYFLTILMRGARADRLICGHLHHLIFARFAAVFNPGLKYYLVAHGIEVWRPYRFWERAALRDAHGIFCVSEYTRRQMLRFDPGLSSDRLIVLPNAVDPCFECETIAGLSQPKDVGPKILVVSRLVATDPYKGVDTMIEAMPLIRKRFPSAQLRIVGGGDDRSRLENITRELGVGDLVEFCGTVDDSGLRREYRECDLFALPSRKEGFGLVYVEAMRFGKPCLAARAGGAPEVVTQSVGALVEYGNIDQISWAVDDLVTHPRKLPEILAQAERFSYSAFKPGLAAALNS